jgi:hypothetical protein
VRGANVNPSPEAIWQIFCMHILFLIIQFKLLTKILLWNKIKIYDYFFYIFLCHIHLSFKHEYFSLIKSN